jgi:hypothetical protein
LHEIKGMTEFNYRWSVASSTQPLTCSTSLPDEADSASLSTIAQPV